MKFVRKEGLKGAHPPCCEGVGIHALDSGVPITLEEIFESHLEYARQWDEPFPEIGGIIRDLGLFILFGYVEVVE